MSSRSKKVVVGASNDSFEVGALKKKWSRPNRDQLFKEYFYREPKNWLYFWFYGFGRRKPELTFSKLNVMLNMSSRNVMPCNLLPGGLCNNSPRTSERESYCIICNLCVFIENLEFKLFLNKASLPLPLLTHLQRAPPEHQ